MSEDMPVEDERSLSRRVCFSRSARYLQSKRAMTCLPEFDRSLQDREREPLLRDGESSIKEQAITCRR